MRCYTLVTFNTVAAFKNYEAKQASQPTNQPKPSLKKHKGLKNAKRSKSIKNYKHLKNNTTINTYKFAKILKYNNKKQKQKLHCLQALIRVLR